MSQCWLGFADLEYDTSGVEQFFTKMYGHENYVIFNETSQKTDKEHIHFCLMSDYKKDTLYKQLTKEFPQIKAERKGRGGSHKYGMKRFPQDYNGNNYDEFPQDYIVKDSNYRCGGLWDNDNSMKYHSTSKDNPLPTTQNYIEWLARLDRITKYLKEKKKDKKSLVVNGKKVPNKESSCQKFEKYLKSYLQEDIRYFYTKTSPCLDKDKLKNVIIKYYQENGKPSNRNVIKVIAEQIIFYGSVVCPEDEGASNTLSQAIDTEIQNLTRIY